MPKHVSMAIALRHLTGSKDLITMLNRMGHCLSYDDVEVMDTSIARELLAKSEALGGVVLPSNIKPGTFVQAAADNNDINEETIDGKATTHATTVVLYQTGNFGPMPQTRMFADHSERLKSLKTQDINQTMLEFSTYGKKPPVTNFVRKMQQEWFTCNEDLSSHTCQMDLAWALVRLCPTRLFEVELIPSPTGEQQVPSWSGCNAIIHQPTQMHTNVGYCPMIHGSSTEFSTIYTVMKKIQAMMTSLGQRDTVITFDLAIYIKAKEIQWRQPEEFANTVIRMGGFHIILNYLSLIGKKYEGSGLEDLLIESDVYGSATVAAIMRGKSYNRSVRAHKLVMEALFRLLWRSFVKWLSERNTSFDLQADLTETIKNCQAAVREGMNVLGSFEMLTRVVSSLEVEFSNFKEESKARSRLFAFWNDYIDMIQLLLQFLRAERRGDWLLHLSVTAAMTPHFFAFDRPNYSRWLPVYLADMNNLPQSHPIVHQEFINGNHSVSRSGNPFSNVSTDMALEQSINRDSKTKGGIGGISKEPGALERWFLTSHQRAAITTALKDMCDMQDNDRVSQHKEATSNRIKKDEESVQSLLTAFTAELMTDPFNLDDLSDGDTASLINFATGVVMPSDDAAQLLKSYESGTSQMTTFVEQRLNTNEKKFWDPLPNLKIKTFAKLSKRTKVKAADEKMVTISADRNLYGRLVIASKTRDVQLKEGLSYELSPVPFSIAHTDGSLRKTNKSVLLAEIQNNVSDDIQPKLPTPTNDMATAYLIDAMAMIQIVKSGGVSTFGELADKQMAVKEEIGQEKLKEGEELVIGGGFTNHNQAVSVTNGVVIRIEALQSDHEEADTRLLLHAKHASQDHKRIVVQSPDTDVAVLCASLFSDLNCQELWFRTGVKDKLRYIPMHKVAEKLGRCLCAALPAFHALTGCDSTSSLSGIGKKKALKVLLGSKTCQEQLLMLGMELPLSDETMINCESFICQLYSTDERAGTKADDMRYWLFCQQQKKNEGLPPTSDSLLHHIKRANYQTYIWRKSLQSEQNLPSPNNHGWKTEDGSLRPVLMTKDPAPHALLVLSFCCCKKSECRRADCSCKVNNLGCTEACQCINSEGCQNPYSRLNASSESDEDD
ncbi:hypothetical protein HOLleu_21334 [Holothuria leucospilota]|uniref:Tesmin/TSO1-like CXC domain-containing protein n=1 Tax=Holothuria leucospilota TaxID=206669 RepID=A0A9Q1BXD2_HOLLE|nr:hypothetical protein HOLleu_21334 [Holothuria leucospilota]